MQGASTNGSMTLTLTLFPFPFFFSLFPNLDTTTPLKETKWYPRWYPVVPRDPKWWETGPNTLTTRARTRTSPDFFITTARQTKARTNDRWCFIPRETDKWQKKPWSGMAVSGAGNEPGLSLSLASSRLWGLFVCWFLACLSCVVFVAFVLLMPFFGVLCVIAFFGWSCHAFCLSMCYFLSCLSL